MTIYSKTSPYFETDQTNGYLDVMKSRDFPFNVDDVVFEITKTYEYRPDLLAFDIYEDVNLWWVFSVRNSSIIKDPIFDFTAGIKIYIPPLDTLTSALGL